DSARTVITSKGTLARQLNSFGRRELSADRLRPFHPEIDDRWVDRLRNNLSTCGPNRDVRAWPGFVGCRHSRRFGRRSAVVLGSEKACHRGAMAATDCKPDRSDRVGLRSAKARRTTKTCHRGAMADITCKPGPSDSVGLRS